MSYERIHTAVIDHASSGDNTIVAAVANKRIRVLSYVIVAAGAVTVRWEAGASGTALSGQMSLAANGGISAPEAILGHFDVPTGVLLNMELGGAVSVDGHLRYAVID